jgi:hypothetical protein
VSRDDRIELRDLPPVESLAHWPERLSMTLARWLDRCPRAAYLYVKAGGGAPTHEMDRGSLTHEALARMMAEWMGRDDDAGYGAGDEEISSITATLVNQVAAERRDLEVSHAEKDVARVCVFHAALGLDVKPSDVVGVERKFYLDLECGWRISGRLDLASMPSSDVGQVDDYKTSLYVPPRSEWDPFQAKMYAVFLLWGRPVDKAPCPNGCDAGEFRERGAAQWIERTGAPCPACGGRGYVEELGDPIGGHLARVIGRELYPRKDPRDRLDGKLARNEAAWTRMELLEFLADLNFIGERLSERLESWKFPARASESWCGECPAENECPIPREYRRFAGHIRTVEDANEAWAWAQRTKARVAQAEREVKKFSADNAVVIEAGDVRWEWAEPTEVRKLRTRGGRTDWEGFEGALAGALERGELFDLRDWLKVETRNSFKKSRVPADQVGASNSTEGLVSDGGQAGDDRDPDERWGTQAPF